AGRVPTVPEPCMPKLDMAGSKRRPEDINLTPSPTHRVGCGGNCSTIGQRAGSVPAVAEPGVVKLLVWASPEHIHLAGPPRYRSGIRRDAASYQRRSSVPAVAEPSVV